MKILLIPNYSRPAATAAAAQLDAWLKNEGVEVAWAPDKKKEPDAVCTAEDCDLVVTLGGDGTLLRGARIVNYSEVPLVGISYGHLGFLTCATIGDDIVQLVADAIAGELHLSRRATLDVEAWVERADGSVDTLRCFALNDVALTHGIYGDIVELDISVSGTPVDRLRADGFVVATATGSTGYALSAGGPIVEPEFGGMICVPIAPHTIQARAFLTNSSDVVELSVSPERPVERSCFVDGQPIELGSRVTRVTVRRGPGDILLFDRGPQSFYQSVSRVFYGKGVR